MRITYRRLTTLFVFFVTAAVLSLLCSSPILAQKSWGDPRTKNHKANEKKAIERVAHQGQTAVVVAEDALAWFNKAADGRKASWGEQQPVFFWMTIWGQQIPAVAYIEGTDILIMTPYKPMKIDLALLSSVYRAQNGEVGKTKGRLFMAFKLEGLHCQRDDKRVINRQALAEFLVQDGTPLTAASMIFPEADSGCQINTTTAAPATPSATAEPTNNGIFSGMP